jgi:protein-histidine pros-kinase
MLQEETRVLMIEDQERDYLLTRRMLASVEGKLFKLDWAASFEAGLDAIRGGIHDVCLLDYDLGERNGLELLKESAKLWCKAPTILLTDLFDYQLDIEAMRLGAADFLVKDQLSPSLLERSIRYAIVQARTLEELRRQQQGLQASELRFRSVVQSAADGIVLVDDEGKIIFWNTGAERMFGYGEDEVLQLPFEMLIPPRYREPHRLALQRFRTTGKAKLIGRPVELEGLRKDGTHFPVELSIAFWTTAEGTFFSGILRDMTERRRVVEMRRAKEKAEQTTRAKSEFVAIMSHELRTPLHAIMGFTSILKQNKAANLSDLEIDLLERILVNARDQLHVINGILDLSKVEAGKMEVQTEPVDIAAIVHEVIKQLEGSRLSPAVVLKSRVPESIRPVVTDGPKLKQVLINLVENALKFTEKGSVTVEVSVHPADFRLVRIDVKDTGTGIPPDQLKKIFEPFQQVGSDTSRSAVGTGLGLSISRSICDLLGYSLHVQSEPGRGSTFSIVLRSEEYGLPIPA